MTDSEFVVMLMPEFSNVYIAMTTKTGQSTGMSLVPCVYDATKGIVYLMLITFVQLRTTMIAILTLTHLLL